MDEIRTISIWDIPTISKYNDRKYENERMPEATPENMLMLVNKINELVEHVNYLEGKVCGWT